MIDPNLAGGLIGIHIVADMYDHKGRVIRQVIKLEDAKVWTDYDIDFNRFAIRVEGKVSQDQAFEGFPTTVPPHPAEESKEITDGEEEIILAELIED